MLTTVDFLVTPLRAYLDFLSTALELTAFLPDGVSDGLAPTRQQPPETDRQAKTQVCDCIRKNPRRHQPSDVAREGTASKDIVRPLLIRRWASSQSPSACS